MKDDEKLRCVQEGQYARLLTHQLLNCQSWPWSSGLSFGQSLVSSLNARFYKGHEKYKHTNLNAQSRGFERFPDAKIQMIPFQFLQPI